MEPWQLILLALVMLVCLIFRRVIASFLGNMWSALRCRSCLSGKTIVIVVVGILLYILLGYVLLVLGTKLSPLAKLASSEIASDQLNAVQWFIGMLTIPLLVIGCGCLLALTFVAVQQSRALFFITVLLLGILVAPIEEAAKYWRGASIVHLTIVTSLTIVLLIVNMIVVFTNKNTSVSGKLGRGLLMIPYTLYPSVGVLFLAAATWYYMSASTASALMKIYVGIFNLIYILALLASPTGIVLLLNPEKTI